MLTTCRFQSASLFFVYIGFLCFQVSLVSNFRPDTRVAVVVTFLGSRVQSCCGEGGTLQTNITGVCGERSQCLSHTGFATTHGVCASPVYTAQALGCSAWNCLMQALGCMHSPGLSCSGSGSWVPHKGADLVGPVFCARPRSKQLRCPGAWRAQSPPVGGCNSLSPPFQPLGFLGVQRAHLLSCAVFLFWGANLWLRPSQRMSVVQNPKKSWLATKSTCSLVSDASLEPNAPFCSGCPCLPVTGGGWAGPKPASSAQSFVL